jgi:hypothetical protein
MGVVESADGLEKHDQGDGELSEGKKETGCRKQVVTAMISSQE